MRVPRAREGGRERRSSARLDLRSKWEQSPARVKERYRSASFVGDRVVFNVKGNGYRLVVYVNYPARVVYVKFVGTHQEYDRVDVKEV